MIYKLPSSETILTISINKLSWFQSRTSTWRSLSRKAGGVALNPLPANPGGALAWSDWAVPPHAPHPNLKTLFGVEKGASNGQWRRKSTKKLVANPGGALAWSDWAVPPHAPHPNLKTLFGVEKGASNGQWRRKSTKKLVKSNEPYLTGWPCKDPMPGAKDKNPNKFNVLVYSYSLLLSTCPILTGQRHQRRRKKNSEAEKFKESTKNGEDFVKSKWLDYQREYDF